MVGSGGGLGSKESVNDGNPGRERERGDMKIKY